MQPQVWLCLLLAVCTRAHDESQERASKISYIADAVGNTIPPPSHGPAQVGSPSKLLTPDRYEFYTFDESGELVKRLMTLEEIQAIVAAGEGTEGHLVTLSNDDQPTIAFNFSQPPFTKVHSVVTNVQNVLKAQMEAQKNNPPSNAPLDTPDVSDSWSLILPSIFGNTGVDIVPDKSSSTFTTPDTETIDGESPISVQIIDNSLRKEGNQFLSSTKIPTFDIKAPTKVETSTSTTSQSTPNTPSKILQTNVTATTIKPRTTSKPASRSTTSAPRTTTIKSKPTTKRSPSTNTIDSYFPAHKNNEINSLKNQYTTKANIVTTTEKIFEKVSTMTTSLPSSPKASEASIKYAVTDTPFVLIKTSPVTLSTKKISSTSIFSSTEIPLKIQPVVTTYKPVKNTYFPVSISGEMDKENNITTLTTQSVSPSTAISTTEIMSDYKLDHLNKSSANDEFFEQNKTNNVNINIPNPLDTPVFDVAQSISQIASDLGNNFPKPTTSDLLETTKINSMELESKESLEMDIPADIKNESFIEITTTKENIVEEKADLFVKVSTIDPSIKTNNTSDSINDDKNITRDIVNITEGTTIDPVLSESMDDLLSQIVNEVPQTLVQTTVKTSELPVNITEQELSTNIQVTTQIPISLDNRINNVIAVLQNTTENNDNKLNMEKTTNSIFNWLTTNGTEKTPNKNMSHQVNNTSVEVASIDSLLTSTEKPIDYIRVNNSNTEISEKIQEDNRLKENSTLFKKDLSRQNDTIAQNMVNLKNSSKEAYNTTLKEGQTQKVFDKSQIGNTNNHVKDRSNITKHSNSEYKVTIVNHKMNTFSETIQKEEFKKKIQKVNIDDKELSDNIRNNSWKLISTVSPPKASEISKDPIKLSDNKSPVDGNEQHKEIILDGSKENQGLEVTIKDLGEDIFQFSELCNELAFRYWNAVVESIDKRRSFVLSPYSITSMLAMMFMGARGATSGEMNEILKLDDMVTFNPHFTLKNISDSIETTPESGIAVSAFIRELYSDRNKGNILTFYKERAQHFYNGHVEEINFKLINDIIRRRTNLLVKRYTWGKIGEYMKTNSITMQPPLAAFSTNIFETDCTVSSVEGRDGEMYFVVSPNVRQRRLVPVPAVVYKNGFLAGYDPVLDATAAAIGTTSYMISTIFLMPGQQGNVVHADDLEALERRLLDSSPATPTWNRLLRTLLPRNGLELQIPRFSHKSTFNISSTLKVMGLKDLFDPENADLGGLNGPSKDLYLSDMIQTTTFVTCGEGVVSEQHQIEEYPENTEVARRRRTSRWTTGWDEPRDYQRAFHDPHDVGEAMHLPLHLRPRQARLPARNAQPARLKFDRPFLYFVRHNPSGMILYVGRYNPRLLP